MGSPTEPGQEVWTQRIEDQKSVTALPRLFDIAANGDYYNLTHAAFVEKGEMPQPGGQEAVPVIIAYSRSPKDPSYIKAADAPSEQTFISHGWVAATREGGSSIYINPLQVTGITETQQEHAKIEFGPFGAIVTQELKTEIAPKIFNALNQAEQGIGQSPGNAMAS